jgi:hypothetical protein
MAGSGGTEFRSYLFQFTELKEAGTTALLEGVEVCEADTDNCATSDSSGAASLDLVADQEVTITIEKTGYGSYVAGDVSDETFGPHAGGGTVAPFRMYTDTQLEAIAADLQTNYPWTGGIVGLLRFPDLHAGVTFEPVGSTVNAVGQSFYYDVAAEEYSLSVDATTAVNAGWLLPLAEGGFTEVTAGEQQFQFGGTAGSCEPSWAWPGDGPNTVRVPVRDGYRTYASMVCVDP